LDTSSDFSATRSRRSAGSSMTSGLPPGSFGMAARIFEPIQRI
jgi:hypothetical protein